MYNEGWTLGDLAGELWARGIDINDISSCDIERVLNYERPEIAAEHIYEEKY